MLIVFDNRFFDPFLLTVTIEFLHGLGPNSELIIRQNGARHVCLHIVERFQTGNGVFELEKLIFLHALFFGLG